MFGSQVVPPSFDDGYPDGQECRTVPFFPLIMIEYTPFPQAHATKSRAGCINSEKPPVSLRKFTSAFVDFIHKNVFLERSNVRE
jgi:hypothetical protein